MSSPDFTVIDLSFPAGSKNKTATLVTGESEALLADAGFTRADGHRLVAAVLDAGKRLTTVFISHGDPDYYFGAEAIADAFPDAVFVATPQTIEHIHHSYVGRRGPGSPAGDTGSRRGVDRDGRLPPGRYRGQGRGRSRPGEREVSGSV